MRHLLRPNSFPLQKDNFMKNVSTKSSDVYLRDAKIPWITFLFLAAVFFVATHDLFFSLIEDFNMPLDLLEKATIEGSLTRRIAFLSLGLLGAVSLMRQGLSRLKINGLLGWLILFYIFWSFLSIAWAEDSALTFRRLVIFAMLCLSALAVSKSFSLRDIIFFVLLSTGFYLLIGIVAEIALGTFHPIEPIYRFAGTIHPNQQGRHFAMLLIAGVTAAQSVKRGRILFLACILIGIIFLILTKSRTSFACAMLALFAYWALLSSLSHKITLFLVVSITFCLFLLLVGDAFFPAMRQGILLGREDPTVYTLTGRVPLWHQCLEYVAKRPLIGYGYNSFFNSRNIRTFSNSQGWALSAGHSVYLELLLNVGCIGMITFVLIFILGIKKSIKYLKIFGNIEYAFLCSLLVFFVFVGILESGLITSSFQMFLSMVVLARLGFQNPQDTKEYS